MARIIAFVLRADQKNKTAEFYKGLGVNLGVENHDDVLHFSARIEADSVLEIYQATSRHTRDAVVIRVDKLEDALTSVGLQSEASRIINRTDSRMIHIQDPDGRSVLLLEYS
jgi:hypothetical protein